MNSLRARAGLATSRKNDSAESDADNGAAVALKDVLGINCMIDRVAPAAIRSGGEIRK